jgi:nucleotide-binding universal stress UspA family protein
VQTTETRIIDGAARVLAEDPGASMGEVAAATGVGRATLYRHYASREELLRALRLHALSECQEALEGVALEGVPAPQALAGALGALLAVVDRYRVLMNAPPPDRSDPDQRTLAEELERPLLDLIVRGQREGVFTSRLAPRLVLEVVLALLRGGRRAIADGVVEAEDAGALLAEALLGGVATPAGAAETWPEPPEVPYRHIACCWDGSPAAERALEEARRLRALAPGRLSVLHVVRYPAVYAPWAPDLEGLREAARTWLERRTADVPEGEAVLLEGSPAVEACAWAERQRVDLLVAASHHGAAHRALLGSFTHHLLHHAPCPVLVVRPEEDEASPGG